MGRKAVVLLPQTQELLSQMGEQIRLARLRRNISSELVANRASVSRATVTATVADRAQIVALCGFVRHIFPFGRKADYRFATVEGSKTKYVWKGRTNV